MLKSIKLLLLLSFFLSIVMAGQAAAGLTDDANLKWIYVPVDDDGDTVNVRTDPVVGTDGTIYIYCNDRKLHAVNPDGTVKWRYRGINESDYTSIPVIGADGTIYVANEYFLFAVTADGKLKWQIPCPNMKRPPAIGPDGVIYVAGVDNLHAINPDGATKWICDVDAATRFSPAIGPDGTIYMGGDTSKIIAVNPWGTIKWKYTTRYNTADAAPSIGADGTIYVTNHGHWLYAINPDGLLQWEHELGDPAWSAPAIAADGTIYVCGGGGLERGLHAINPDGTEQWMYHGNQFCEKASPCIGSDGTVYFGSGSHYFNAMSPDGELLWQYDGDNNITGSPVIAPDGTVYVSNNTLIAFQTESYGYQAGAPWPNRMVNNTRSIAGDVILPPLYTVRGQVALPDSTPLVDVPVSVDGLVVTTDEFGIYTFYLPDGEYTVNYLVDSTMIPKSVDVTVDGADVFVDIFAPSKYTVHGRVVDRAGPVSGVTVSVGSSLCLTDDNGGYSFSLAQGGYSVKFDTDAGDFPAIKDIVVSGADVSVDDLRLNRQAWTLAFSDDNREPPLVGHDGTLYFTEALRGEVKICAISSEGVIGHEYILGIPYIDTPAQADDGTLYIPVNDRLIALSPTLEPKWTFEVTENGAQTTPAVGVDGTIYFNPNGKLCALNPDGTIRWEYTVDSRGCDSPVIAGDGTIYFPCSDGNLYAMNPDGTPRWILGGNSSSFRTPAIGVDGTLYYGGWNCEFFAVNPDGTRKWTIETDNACSAHATIGSDSTIFFVVQGCRVYAVDPEGNIKWSRQVSYEESMYQPYYYDQCDEIWIWDENETIALNSDGTVKWRHDEALVFPVAGSEGRIYLCEYAETRGMELHAYEMAVTGPQVGIEDSADNNLQIDMPSMISLTRNYPNPFNPVTTISFTLAAESLVSVDIYTITGQHAGSLAHERMTAGEHLITWNGSNHPTGVYFARIAAGEAVSVRKMLLLK